MLPTTLLEPGQYVFAGSTKTQADWDALYEVSHPKCADLPIWNYKWNLCTECESPLTICRHNPYGTYGEITKARKEAYALALAEQAARFEEEKATAFLALENSTTGAPVKIPGRKGKARTTRLALREDEFEEALAELDGGKAMTVIAKERNVPALWLSNFFKENGRVLSKGKKTRKTRKELSSNEQAEVLAKFDADVTISVLCVEYNVAPKYLSDWLKSQNRTVKKGAGKKGVRPAGFGRQKKVIPALSQSVIDEMVKRHKTENLGSTVLAKMYGFPQPMVSAALKLAGCEIKKGKPKKLQPVV